MGREIRRVPPNYEPAMCQSGQEIHQPKYNKTWKEAIKEWKDGYKQWEEGTHESYEDYKDHEYWQYESPPDEYYYLDYEIEDATWYQSYETVSEGTPVTPAFETKQELIDYLVTYGDYWDQRRRKEYGNTSYMNCDPWTKGQAESFVNNETVLSSLMIKNGVIYERG